MPRTGRERAEGWRAPPALEPAAEPCPLPWTANPTGPNGVASEMVLSSTSTRTRAAQTACCSAAATACRSGPSSPGREQPARAAARPAPRPDTPRSCRSTSAASGYCMLRDEIRPPGIADHKVADLLGTEPYLIEVIAAVTPRRSNSRLNSAWRSAAARSRRRRRASEEQDEQRERQRTSRPRPHVKGARRSSSAAQRHATPPSGRSAAHSIGLY